MALRPAAMAALEPVEHRPDEPAVRAGRHGRDVDHDLAARHRADLAVVGRPEAAIGHLHDPRRGVRRRGARLALPGDLALVRLGPARSEEHTSELPSLMRISYAVFCLKKKITTNQT